MDSDTLQAPANIFIVDTSNLIHTASSVPFSLQTADAQKRDAWVALSTVFYQVAKKGHAAVVIPEMVTFETAAVLGDGFCVNENLPEGHKIRGYRDISVRDFTVQVPGSLGHIGITSPPKDDDTPAADHMRRIWAIRNSVGDLQRASWEIARLDRGTNTHDYGDMAALKLIEKAQTHKTSIFYFAEDRKAEKKARAYGPNVFPVRVAHMYEAMQRTGLLQFFGIRPDVSYEVWRKHCAPRLMMELPAKDGQNHTEALCAVFEPWGRIVRERARRPRVEHFTL